MENPESMEDESEGASTVEGEKLLRGGKGRQPPVGFKSKKKKRLRAALDGCEKKEGVFIYTLYNTDCI